MTRTTCCAVSAVEGHTRESGMRREGWYYSGDGRTRHGPLSYEQLRTLADAGQLLPQHFVLEPGQRHWARAGAVPGLFALLEALPADLPRSRADGAVAVRRFLSRVADVAGVVVFLAFLLAVAIN